MIRKFETQDLDAVMQIWLHGNLDAHPFIPASFWTDHFEMVRDILPQAEHYVHENEATRQIDGFIGLTENHIEGIFVAKARPSVRSRKVDTLKAAYSALTKLNLLHYSKIRYERQSRSQDGFQLLKSWGCFQKVHFLTHTEFLPVPVSDVCGTRAAVPPARRRTPQRCCR